MEGNHRVLLAVAAQRHAVERVSTISQEHSALCEEIAANMDLQTTSLEKLDDTISSLNNQL